MSDLSEMEQADTRRFCGYPVVGTRNFSLNIMGRHPHALALDQRIHSLTGTELTLLRRYLATLTGLELAIPRAGENLDTDEAAVWSRNKTEVKDRIVLFDNWRHRLCGFLGIPPGPGLTAADHWIVV